jgi:hypothetical protein
LAGLTPARALLLGFAAFALALGACSKSSNPPTPTPTTSTFPTVPPSSTPFPSTAGVAYIPDGGNGGSPGLTVAHFEQFSGQFFHYPPQLVNFASSVRSYALASDASVGLAVLRGGAGPGAGYALLQGVLGTSIANPFPGGPPYDTSVQPTAAPSSTPPPPGAVIPDVTSATLLLTGTSAVGLAMGPAATGILGVNQPANQTPTFNGFVGYTCGNTTISPSSGRANIAVSPAANATNGVFSALVRGPGDLVSFSVTPNFGIAPPVYVFCVTSHDTALGTHGTLLGRGAMAFSPTDSRRAVVAQSGSAANTVTLITGLPTAITKAPAVALSGGKRASSVAISPGGSFAVIGADSGMYVVSGVALSSLTPVPQGSPASTGPYHPSYVGSDGMSHPLQNVTSVGFSLDGSYVATLASTTPDSPGGGTNASLVVLPFNTTNGVLSAPVVVDNGLVSPAFFEDFMIVR